MLNGAVVQSVRFHDPHILDLRPWLVTPDALPDGFCYEFPKVENSDTATFWPNEAQIKACYEAEKSKTPQARIATLHKRMDQPDDAVIDTFQHRRDLKRLHEIRELSRLREIGVYHVDSAIDVNPLHYGVLHGNTAQPDPLDETDNEESRAWCWLELCEALELPVSTVALKAVEVVASSHEKGTSKQKLRTAAVKLMHEWDPGCSIPLRKSKKSGAQHNIAKPDWSIDAKAAALRAAWLGYGPDADEDWRRGKGYEEDFADDSGITYGSSFRAVRRKTQPQTPGFKAKASDAAYEVRQERERKRKARTGAWKKRRHTELRCPRCRHASLSKRARKKARLWQWTTPQGNGLAQCGRCHSVFMADSASLGVSLPSAPKDKHWCVIWQGIERPGYAMVSARGADGKVEWHNGQRSWTDEELNAALASQIRRVRTWQPKPQPEPLPQARKARPCGVCARFHPVYCIEKPAWRENAAPYGCGNRDADLRENLYHIYGILTQPLTCYSPRRVDAWVIFLGGFSPVTLHQQGTRNQRRLRSSKLWRPMTAEREAVYDFARRAAEKYAKKLGLEVDALTDLDGRAFLHERFLPQPAAAQFRTQVKAANGSWIEEYSDAWEKGGESHICAETDPCWDFDVNSYRAITSDVDVNRIGGGEQTSVVLTRRIYPERGKEQDRVVGRFIRWYFNGKTYSGSVKISRGLCRLSKNGRVGKNGNHTIDQGAQWYRALAEWDLKHGVTGAIIDEDLEERIFERGGRLDLYYATGEPPLRGKPPETAGMRIEEQRAMMNETLKQPWEYQHITTRFTELGIKQPCPPRNEPARPWKPFQHPIQDWHCFRQSMRSHITVWEFPERPMPSITLATRAALLNAVLFHERGDGRVAVRIGYLAWPLNLIAAECEKWEAWVVRRSTLRPDIAARCARLAKELNSVTDGYQRIWDGYHVAVLMDLCSAAAVRRLADECWLLKHHHERPLVPGGMLPSAAERHWPDNAEARGLATTLQSDSVRRSGKSMAVYSLEFTSPLSV